jgi:hypothetical protein
MEYRFNGKAKFWGQTANYHAIVCWSEVTLSWCVDVKAFDNTGEMIDGFIRHVPDLNDDLKPSIPPRKAATMAIRNRDAYR